MKKFIYLCLLLLPISVAAKTTTTTKKVNTANKLQITCDKTDKINLNEQIICRVSINTAFLYNEINLNISEHEGFEITDIRSNSSKVWKITTENNKEVIKATSEEVQNDLQEFGIILLKAVKSGNFNLKINNIKLVNNLSENSSDKELDEISQELKVVSTDNLLKAIYINDESLENFDSNKTTYDYYINNEETIKISVESSNEFSTVEGAGEYKIDLKEAKTIIPISVISEDGSSRIYTLNIVRKDYNNNNIDKSLESLIIKNDKGNIILIDFNKDTYEYTFDVDINTVSLDIKPEISNKDNSFVKGYGEQKLKLNSGSNIVIIKIKDAEGETLNYVLNITKPIANKSDNNYIKSLLIKNHKLAFAKRVKNYTLEIDKNETSLEIIPTLDSEKATYYINGNSNLKDGSVIKIIVTAENDEKLTYKINIKIKKTSYTKYFLIIIAAVILVFLETKYHDNIIKLFKKKQKKAPIRRKVTNVKVITPKAPKKKKSNKKKKTNNINKNNNSSNNKKTTNVKTKTSKTSNNKSKNTKKRSNNNNKK